MTILGKPLRHDDRLRAAPTFSQNFAFDGRPYVAKDVEPYTQYWLDDRERVLLSMFSRRRGATVAEALAGSMCMLGREPTERERTRLTAAIDDMRTAGVLVAMRDDTSRYTARIAADYVRHRPFPRQIARVMIRDGRIGPASEVLDLAGGPGDLALQLATVSRRVTLMELSRGFIAAARRRARKAGLHLRLELDSCNRLMSRDEQYDVVTISQALHWMDDVMVCRGLCRCLRDGGSFFVVQGGFDVPDEHPLAYLFGARSILGARPQAAFAEQVQALYRRLGLLFEALDAPDVQRVDPSQQREDGRAVRRIVPAGARLFKQRRPIGLGFARAFLTPEHIAVTGQSPQAFWAEVEARCKAASAARLLGRYDWGLLSFKRDGLARQASASTWRRVAPIGFEPSSI